MPGLRTFPMKTRPTPPTGPFVQHIETLCDDVLE